MSLLWFKRKLPKYATKFVEMCIMLCADHGPCVSGAHNAIVTSRAGKDIVSCLVSGLLTIGPRFGGAIDDAARCARALSRRCARFLRHPSPTRGITSRRALAACGARGPSA